MLWNIAEVLVVTELQPLAKHLLHFDGDINPMVDNTVAIYNAMA